MKRREQGEMLLRKAAQDLSLIDQVLMSESVSDEIIGFHAQQAAEKMLKAVLSELGVRFRKTHDIGALCELLADAGVNVPESLGSLDELTPFGAVYRYEDFESPSGLDRVRTREMLGELRRWVEAVLRSRD